MSLDNLQYKTLLQAIQDYDFPCVTFDFNGQREIIHPSMREVEIAIRDQLLSHHIAVIKNGLSNVLYWGYARTGYRPTRVGNFRAKVTDQQLGKAQLLFQKISGSAVRRIADIDLPEFSGLSFLSKTRMFLDPINYVVLDIQLLKLRDQLQSNIFHEIHADPKPTTIRATRHNERVYEKWAAFCRRVAIEYFSDTGYRAVDIERGIFYLVQSNRANDAAMILQNA
jgi:hypothetical protein